LKFSGNPNVYYIVHFYVATFNTAVSVTMSIVKSTMM
jgi:hypothetical protein